MQPKIKKKDFEFIIKYIDDHIEEEYGDILHGLNSKAMWCIQVFQQLIHKKNKMRLRGYVTKRKLYFTFQALKASPEQKIGVTADFIAQCSINYFNRQFRAEFGLTPTEARAYPEKVTDNRLTYKEFCDMEDTTVATNSDNTIVYEPNSWMLDIVEYAKCEYGFDYVMCRDLINMAERLGVPAMLFVDRCFDMMIDAHEDGNNSLSPKMEVGIDLGLSSEQEIDEICEYYGCSFMELDISMVLMYRDRDNIAQ